MDPPVPGVRIMSDRTTANLIQAEAALVESGLSLQSEGLKLLLAEMQALAALLPAAVPPKSTAANIDAQIEADQDNMPV
jgi:hypothetical protein